MVSKLVSTLFFCMFQASAYIDVAGVGGDHFVLLPMQTLISSDLFIVFLNVFFNCLIIVTFACYFAMLHETPCNFTLLLI